MASDDTPDAVLKDRSAAGSGPERPNAPKGVSGKPCEPVGEPERKCVLSGLRGERSGLIRLALGPDGAVWPDLGARLPGRGAWIAPDRPMLALAMKKGRLKGALARAFGSPATIPDDLPQRIADGLERRALDRLGLELRAGHLIFGSEKLIEWARAGRLHLLLHAGDATDNGVQKLNQAWRVGQAALRDDSEGADDADSGFEDDDTEIGVVTADSEAIESVDGEGRGRLRRGGSGDMAGVHRLPAGRLPLSRALGRENIVHSGVTDGKAAARIATDVSRWIAYAGLATAGSDEPMNDGGALPDRRNDEGRE